MKKKIAARMVIVGAVAGMLMGCEEPPAPVRKPEVMTPATRPAVAVAVVKPAAIRLVKPPTLGPMGPSIVILPAQMDEPQIRVRLTSESDRPPTIARGKYRGRVETLKLANGKYVALNVLPLDSYLQGVLAKEMYGSWEPAAYRAQAIAARTFALYQMVTDGRTKQWDVADDETSQMYGGIAGETAKSRGAVAETRGEVLMATVEGKTGIFCSFYSACTGGATQDPFEAWGDSSVGPLKAHVVGNVDDNCDKFIWKTDFVASRADVTRCVRAWGERNHFEYLQNFGPVVGVKIAKRNAATGRPTEFTLTDAAGKSVPIRAEEFRIALLRDPLGRAPKPYSSFFEIRAEGESFVMYNGRGYGHGIGLSQWGAQAMAKGGSTHEQILNLFYVGAGLRRLW